MKIVLFDTETTGLLLPDNAPIESQPSIIEFFGVAIDEDFNIIDSVDELIYPGELVTDEITRITGIKNSQLDGKPMFYDVREAITELFKDSDLEVAHNLAFDRAMLENEYTRLDETFSGSKDGLCTVEAWKDKFGNRISLGMLHRKLFKKDFKAHRAKEDVYALVRVFNELISIGVIDLDIYKK